MLEEAARRARQFRNEKLILRHDVVACDSSFVVETKVFGRTSNCCFLLLNVQSHLVALLLIHTCGDEYQSQSHFYRGRRQGSSYLL